MNANTQPTYKRQRFLLAFIRQLNESVSATDLQKLVFLHTMQEGRDFYEFLPYRFGSYSFQLTEDVDILSKNGYLAVKNMREGKHVEAIGIYSKENLFSIESERGNNLIRKAYRKYPYYTIKSEMVDRLYFSEEDLIHFNTEKQKYSQTEQFLFTIGYEGKSIEAFVNTLIQNGVKVLCDVRKNPLSRKFGFSKSKLEHIVGTVGIKYIHMPSLGIESDKRCSLNSDEDYTALFAEYSKALVGLTSQLGQVYSLLCTNNRIALMCFEKNAKMCHRHVISNYIVTANKVRSEDL